MEIRLKTSEEFRDAHMTIEIKATPDGAWRLSDRLYTADEVGDLQTSEAELVSAPLRAQADENKAWAERTEAQLIEVTNSRDRERNRAEAAGKLLAESQNLVEFKSKVEEELRRNVVELREKIRLYDHDRVTERDRADSLRTQLQGKEDLIHKRSIRVTELARRVAELERGLSASMKRERELEDQNQRLVEEINAREVAASEEDTIYAQSIASRDALLTAATRRVQNAKEALTSSPVEHARKNALATRTVILADAVTNALAALNA